MGTKVSLKSRKWAAREFDDDIRAMGLVGLEVLEPTDVATPPSNKKRKTDKSGRIARDESKISKAEPKEEVSEPKEEEGASPWVEGEWNISKLTGVSEETKAQLLSYARSFSLSPVLVKNIHNALGWCLGPTAIQTKVVPVAIATGYDICIASETGSGKTACFALPVLHALIQRCHSCESPQLRALVLVPSRELAVQAAACFSALGRGSGVVTTCTVGGISIDKQIRQLSKRPAVVVGTIGRLSALAFGDSEQQIWPHAHLQSFKGLTHLVLDEADRLLETGKVRQVRMFFDKLIKDNDGKRGRCQIIVASATLMMDAKSTAHASKKKVSFKEAHALSFIPIRDKENVTIDLTTASASDSVQLKISENIRLKQVHISDIKERDKWLYVLLEKIYRHRTADKPFKTIVFANSIDYVSRAHSLLALLLDATKLTTTANTTTVTTTVPTTVTTTVATDQAPALATAPASKGVAALMERWRANKATAATAPAPASSASNSKAAKKYQSLPRETTTVSVLALNSKMKQKSRCQVFERFNKTETSAVLIATDVAARGLDFPSVDLVIHAQAPRTAQSLVHRTGRTARGLDANGKPATGEAWFFTTPDEVDIYDQHFKQLGLQRSGRVEDLETVHALTKKQHQTANQLVQLAVTVERAEHRLKRDQQDRAWLKNACDRAELAYESEEEAHLQDFSDSERLNAGISSASPTERATAQQLNAFKAQLRNGLLAYTQLQ